MAMRSCRLLFSLSVWFAVVPVSRGQDIASPPRPADAPSEPTEREQTPPEPSVAEESAGSALTGEIVRGRMTQVESNRELADTLRLQLLDSYRQTLTQLDLAKTWQDKSTTFHNGIEEAPNLLTTTRQAIDKAASTKPPKAEPPPNATLAQLVERQNNVEQALSTARERLRELETEATRRAERRTSLPGLIADANKRLEALKVETALPAGDASPPQLAEATQWLQRSKRRAIQEEIRAYETELRFYEARGDVLSAKREQTRGDVTRQEALAGSWNTLVATQREAEAKAQKQIADQAAENLQDYPAPIRQLADQNAVLAAEQADLAKLIQKTEKKVSEIKKLNDSLAREYEALKQNAGNPLLQDVDILGAQMRRMRDRLRSYRKYQQQREDAEREYHRAVLQEVKYEEERQRLATGLSAEISSRMQELDGSASKGRREKLKEKVSELLDGRRERLPLVIREYEDYAKDANDLFLALSNVLNQVNLLGDFVEEHVLWLRSGPPLHALPRPGKDAEEERNLRQEWSAVTAAWYADLSQLIELYIFASAGFVMLLFLRRAATRKLNATCERVARVWTDTAWLTPTALCMVIVKAVIGPLVLLFIAWRLGRVSYTLTDRARDLALALNTALLGAAALWLTTRLVSVFSASGGFAEKHLRWNAAALKRARRAVKVFQYAGVPLVFLIITAQQGADSVWRDWATRLSFMALMVLALLSAARLFHPSRGVIALQFQRRQAARAYQYRYVWFAAAVLIPLTLLLASYFGFHYTALEFSQRLTVTVWIGLLVLLVHALSMRWVFYAQRKLAAAEAERKRAAAMEQAKQEGSPASEKPPIDESAIDLVSVGEQSRQLLGTAAGFAVLIALWFTWADIVPALSFLDDVHVWEYTKEVMEPAAEPGGNALMRLEPHYITMGHALAAALTAFITGVLAKNIPGLLEIVLVRQFSVDTGARFAAISLTRYAIVVIGVVVAFGLVGIGWSQVQWLVAAVSVGLGFGLQEIFANFVSGIMILFERPIRVGDTVTVADVSGTVTRIRIRATTITGWDRKELVIPNKEFITGRVINWTLSDNTQRVIIKVGIAYGSDVQKAVEVLQRVAKENKLVLTEPASRVLFTGFGDNSLNLELRAYLASMDDYLTAIDMLHRSIDAAFRRADIEIAFPQRDIHIRTIKARLPIEQEKPGGGVQASARSEPEA